MMEQSEEEGVNFVVVHSDNILEQRAVFTLYTTLFAKRDELIAITIFTLAAKNLKVDNNFLQGESLY